MKHDIDALMAGIKSSDLWNDQEGKIDDVRRWSYGDVENNGNGTSHISCWWWR